LANGVHLNEQQLQHALSFCAGLPLALTLLQGALHADLQAGGSCDSVLQRLELYGSISCDTQDKLRDALLFSVECLSGELQIVWKDLVQLFAARSANQRRYSLQITSDKLGALFGQQNLRELQLRNLVVLKGVHYVEVVVHDVLLCMADYMCGPDTDNYHWQARRDISTGVSWQFPACTVGRVELELGVVPTSC
jgi:hypothetical protein